MSQPELQVPFDHLEVDGLEEIFVEPEAVAQRPREGDATPTRGGLTFKEACAFFGLKPTALRVRIKSGEITAEKIHGVNGPEWRIHPEDPAQPSRNPSVRLTTPSRDPFTTSVLGPDPNKLIVLIEDLQIKLDKANHELQAASFRNGYLESRVESQKVEIKLLTDRHKKGWWQRFCSWFAGTTSNVT